MRNDPGAILSLVALGRITPREAERLLALWRDGDETILQVALCLALFSLALPYVGDIVIGFGHVLATMFPAIEHVLLRIGRMA